RSSRKNSKSSSSPRSRRGGRSSDSIRRTRRRGRSTRSSGVRRRPYPVSHWPLRIALIAACLGLATPLCAAPKPVKIALFVAIQANPVEQSIIETFKQVAEKDGATKLVVFDSNNSVQKELANCNDAIAAGGFDAFALKAVAGPPLMACARAAIAAKIPVVVFGNALGPNPNTAARQIPGLAGSVIELAQTNGRAIAALVNEACVARGKNPCNVAYAYGPLADQDAAADPSRARRRRDRRRLRRRRRDRRPQGCRQGAGPRRAGHRRGALQPGQGSDRQGRTVRQHLPDARDRGADGRGIR